MSHCTKDDINNSVILNGKISKHTLMSNKILTPYDIFKHIQRRHHIKNHQLSDCEKRIKAFYYIISNYTSPDMKIKYTPEQKIELKNKLRQIIDIINKEHPHIKNIPFKMIMGGGKQVIEQFTTKHNGGKQISLLNIILIIICIWLIIRYVF